MPLWDVDSGKERARLEAHTDQVIWVGFSRDGRTIVSGSRDRSVRFWSSSTALLALTRRAVAGRAASYAFAPSGHIELFGDASAFPVCRVDTVSYPFELCQERFLTPRLTARVLAGDASYLEP